MSQTISLKWEVPAPRRGANRLGMTAIAWVLVGGAIGLLAMYLNSPEWWGSYAAATAGAFIATLLTLPTRLLLNLEQRRWGRVLSTTMCAARAVLMLSFAVSLAVAWGGTPTLALALSAGYAVVMTAVDGWR